MLHDVAGFDAGVCQRLVVVDQLGAVTQDTDPARRAAARRRRLVEYSEQPALLRCTQLLNSEAGMQLCINAAKQRSRISNKS